MANPDSYLGLVQQIGPGVFITKPAKLVVIRAGEGQAARHLYIALLGSRTLSELDYDIGSARLAANLQSNTPDTYINQTSYLLQQQLGYVAIKGPQDLDGLFLRTPDRDLDKKKGIEGVIETLSITGI